MPSVVVGASKPLILCTLFQLLYSSLILSAGAVNELSSRINHERCFLGTELARLASKHLDIEQILQAPVQARQCMAKDSRTKKQSIRAAFVTPWNAQGEAYTLLHCESLTHVFPVWYQIKVSSRSATLHGDDVVNEEWLTRLRLCTKPPGIMPRYEVQFTEAIAFDLLSGGSLVSQTARAILQNVIAEGYDGATLEVPHTRRMSALVRHLGTKLHENGKSLVLVIPAQHKQRSKSPFSKRDLEKVFEFVDLFSLNAYDHASTLGRETGNAPLPWVRSMLEDLLGFNAGKSGDKRSSTFDDSIALHEKLLLGINFYGHTLTSDSVLNTVTAREYAGLLEFSQTAIPLNPFWDEEKAEHVLQSTLWNIWFPTVLSLLYRLELVKEFGIGVSIWEAGQGFNYWWDVLAATDH